MSKETKIAKENIKMLGCEINKNSLISIFGLIIVVWTLFIHGLIKGFEGVHYIVILPLCLIGLFLVYKKVKVLK